MMWCCVFTYDTFLSYLQYSNGLDLDSDSLRYHTVATVWLNEIEESSKMLLRFFTLFLFVCLYWDCVLVRYLRAVVAQKHGERGEHKPKKEIEYTQVYPYTFVDYGSTTTR